MKETTIRLAAQLADSKSPDEALTLLAAAPVVLAELMEVARHGERYGLAREKARTLFEMQSWLAMAVRALTGDLDASIPAGVYGMLAMVSRRHNKIEQARRFYYFAFENATQPPEKASALGGIALLDAAMGKPDRARSFYRKGVELCLGAGLKGANLGFLLSNWGGLEMDQKQFSTADQLFRRAHSIAVEEQLEEVYLIARLQQAELSLRQEKSNEALEYLDDIKWIEGTESPCKSDYRALRQKISGVRQEKILDPVSKSIHALEKYLLEFPSTPERERILRILGAKYFAIISSSRADNLRVAALYWGQALKLLETSSNHSEHASPTLAALHTGLGSVYNELFDIEHDAEHPTRAKEHFEKALRLIPKIPESLEQRQKLLNDLGNAIARASRVSLATPIGEPDFQLLHESLTVQTELLETVHDPVMRCQIMLNISETYSELSAAPDSDVRQYRSQAWDFSLAAESAVADVFNLSSNLALPIAAFKGRTAVEMGRSTAELHQLAIVLDHLLERERKSSSAPSIRLSEAFYASARLARALGDRARTYRRYLQALRPLRSTASSSDRAVVHYHVWSELVSDLVEWGELERAIWFSGASRLVQRLNRHYRPFVRRRWRPIDSSVVLFQALSPQRLLAFVLTSNGVEVRDLPVPSQRLIYVSLSFLQRRCNADSRHEISKNFTDFTTYIGETLFQPIEDLLPAGGNLAIIPVFSMSKLPLHAAVLKSGERLLDRFAVVRYQELSFEEETVKPMAATGQGIFIATYSPADARLPFAAAEAHAISECYGNVPDIELTENATPEDVLRGLQKTRIAHLCCHGAFDWHSPLNSKLLFAERPLSLREITLSLARSPCELVVLSACEAGAYVQDDEDESDFATMILRAGCGMVISADWRIDDLSTAVLMEKMHKAISSGMSFGEALARAQHAMQTETSEAVANSISEWIKMPTIRLLPSEQQYLMAKITSLRLHPNEMPFKDPMFWGYFSAQAAKLLLTPQRTRNWAILRREVP